MAKSVRRWCSQLLPLSLLLALPFLLWSCKACQQQGNTSARTVQLLLPQRHYGLLAVPRLGDIPTRLNQLLERFEGPTQPGKPALGQMRRYVQEFRNAIGVDLLDPKSLPAHGIAPKGALFAMRLRLAGHKGLLAVVPVQSRQRFAALLKKVARERLLAKTIRSKKLPSTTVHTVYRLRKDGVTEEFAYAFVGDLALVVRPVIDNPPDKPTTYGAAIVQALLSLKPTNSLKQDNTFQAAWKRWKDKAQVVLYTPLKTKSKSTAKAAPRQRDKATPKPAPRQRDKAAPKAPTRQRDKAAPKPAPGQRDKAAPTAPATRPTSRRLAPVRKRPAPLFQRVLSRLRRYNPFTKSTSALTFGARGIQMDAALPLQSSLAQSFQKAVPSTGQPKALLRLVNKRAIAGFKLSFNPQKLPSLLARAMSTSQADLSPEQLYGLLKKHTGLELQKDIIPLLTGHAMLSLYHVYPQVYQRFQRSPAFLPSALELAVVAELKDPKKAQQVLDTLAKKLTIAGQKVRTVPTRDKRKQYKITAWPQSTAYWTIVGNTFVYALGKGPIKLAVQALKHPKFRLYPKQAPEALTAKDSVAVHLHLPNLMRTFNSLYIPFTIKMVVTNFYLMNLKNIEALLLSYRPGSEQLHLQLKVQLKAAPPAKSQPKARP